MAVDPVARSGASPPTPEALESLLDHNSRRGLWQRRLVPGEWAGGIEQEMARVPSVRIGRRWVSTLWLLPLTVVGLVVAVALAQQLRRYGWMQDFIATYPGTADSFATPLHSGFPAWLRWQHLFNIVFMMFLMRAGLQILADHPRLYLNSGCRPGSAWLRMRAAVPADRMDKSRPDRLWTAKDDSVALPAWMGIPGIRHTVGLARWWHFVFDLFWLANGLVFYVLLFTTGQWRRIVPQSWEVLPNAASTAVQYASLDFPVNAGFTNYNGLQMIAYFTTVFIAAPLAFATGLLQAPGVAARFGFARGPLNRQVARSVHFGVLVWMVVFIVIHTVMVFTTGLVGNLNHIVLGTDTESYGPLIVYVAAMVMIGVAWLAASPLTLRYPAVVRRVGVAVVGWAKALMERPHPNATYAESDISSYLWPNGTLPDSALYRRLQAGNWADYALAVTGLVENPRTFSYDQLRALPKHEQVTGHYCIQGWSGVAKWGGVAMADILEEVRPLPNAHWVVFYSFAEGSGPSTEGRYYDCHKIEHMREPTTLLAYEMNDAPLTVAHGAPLRLRNEHELGFKMVKWVQAIEFVESFERLGLGMGGYNEDHEYYGYRMPI